MKKRPIKLISRKRERERVKVLELRIRKFCFYGLLIEFSFLKNCKIVICNPRRRSSWEAGWIVTGGPIKTSEHDQTPDVH